MALASGCSDVRYVGSTGNLEAAAYLGSTGNWYEMGYVDGINDFHHGAGCGDCHVVYEDTDNIGLIRMTVTIPSGPSQGTVKTVSFSSKSGTNSYADGQAPYDGVCEVCHTQTRFHRNDGTGEPGHFEGENCMGCHLHNNSLSPKYTAGHATHTKAERGPKLACSGCHTDNRGTLPQGSDLAGTDLCNNCHSPGGAYDGVNDGNIGAKANWTDGVYEGGQLASGKETWCVGCHDDAPANSKVDGSGVSAPKVGGDGSTWGFFVSGHGRSGMTGCLECHSANMPHIDGISRTYTVDESQGNAVVNPYCASYRLPNVGGQPCLEMPLATASDPRPQTARYALCGQCHELGDIVGRASWVDHVTNFWGTNDYANAHNKHLSFSGIRVDSDFDGTADSAHNCVACHNVHGSPSPAMMRHGELIGKVPAANFNYLVPHPGPFASATFTPNLPASQVYGVYAWWVANPYRTPNVPFDVSYDGGTQRVLASQLDNGGQWNLLGSWSFAAGTSGKVVISTEGAGEGGSVTKWIMADAVGWDQDGDGTPDIIVDNEAATYTSTWNLGNHAEAWGGTHRYHAWETHVPDANTALENSAGGWFDMSGGLNTNGMCNGCHNSDKTTWIRVPNLSPRVLQARATPNKVVDDGTAVVRLSARGTDVDGTVSDMKIDLSPIGGSATQQMYDDGSHGDTTAGDGVWSVQYSVPASAVEGSFLLNVLATDNNANTGKGDAELLVMEPGAIYVDDNDGAPAYTTVGDWTRESPVPGQITWGPFYNTLPAGSGTNVATWRPTLPTTGTYKVYAWWWGVGTIWNRATDAPYTVHYSGGTATIGTDQRAWGNQWNLLGTWPFLAGDSGYVALSDGANGSVMADALKFVLQ